MCPPAGSDSILRSYEHAFGACYRDVTIHASIMSARYSRLKAPYRAASVNPQPCVILLTKTNIPSSKHYPSLATSCMFGEWVSSNCNISNTIKLFIISGLSKSYVTLLSHVLMSLGLLYKSYLLLLLFIIIRKSLKNC